MNTLLLSVVLGAPPQAPPVIVPPQAPPTRECFNCTSCGSKCGCFGGGYYCANGKCPIVFPKNSSGVVVGTVPGVTVSPFRQTSIGGYNRSHNCPNCGTAQYRVSGYNRDGTHNHTCPRCGTVWRH